MRKFYFCILLFFSLAICQAAQTPFNKNYYFTHITGDDGLSQSNVKSIVQDNYGFMWFGTKNGLNRYDGNTIKTIDCDDYIKNIGNHNVSALFVDNENKMWVGTDKGVFIYDPVTELFDYQDMKDQKGMPMDNWVSEINADPYGNIWIVLPTHGVFRINNGKLFHYFITDNNYYSNKHPFSLAVTSNGDIWIGTYNAGLFKYDRDNDSFQQYLTDRNGNSLALDNIYRISEFGEYIAIGVHEGELKKMHTVTGEISLIDAPEVHYSVIRDLKYYDDNLWVGTQDGLFIINKKGFVNHVNEDVMNPYGLSDKNIYSIYQDKEKGVWVGTQFGGVNYYGNYQMEFMKYMSSTTYSQNGNRIREIVEDDKGRIWIGTENKGISVLDPERNQISPIAYDELRTNNCQNSLAMMIKGNNLYSGFFKRGLYQINIDTHQTKFYTQEMLNLDEASIYALYTDSKDNVWLGNAKGVFIKRKDENRFKKIPKLEIWPSDIVEDEDGFIWFASMGMGLCRFNPETEEDIYYLHDPNDPETVSSNTISSITIDSKGHLWLSTDRGGVCKYEKETDNFTTYSVKEGLPDDVAYKVLEDSIGNIWFGTNRGLVCLNPQTDEIQVFTKHDGLLSNQFNYKSALKSKSGLFYFGSIDGLVSFDPMLNKKTEFEAPVYITKLSIYNEEITQYSGNSSITENIIFSKEIKLAHNQENLSFDFAALSYSNQGPINYRYRMINLDKDWIVAKSNKNITYSKLPPGDYNFVVQATNTLSHWDNSTSTTLRITILPPWWLSSVAYFVYMLLITGFILMFFHWYKKRKDKQILQKQQIFEIEKEKELHQAKIEFFTEIAHEIRTPLTLINGPLESVLSIDTQDVKIKKNLNIIHQNTNRLLELTRQLLDFRKIGANKVVLNFVIVDIQKFLEDIISRFEPTFEYQKKKISVSMPKEPFQAAIDKEAVTKIISNLLTNALKYSDSEIFIELGKDSSHFTIKISNDGDKIPEEQRKRIFEPFYQIDNQSGKGGAGIGLPLSQSLAEMHKGQITVDLEDDKNVFILKLPLEQDVVIKLDAPVVGPDIINEEYISSDETSWFPTAEMENYRILFVEDNDSIRSFMAEKLSETFTVETASNGLEALEMLRKETFDIIISDIMMPQMDGMELCKKVKSDAELNYIPFVFVTARNDIENKINGLKAGAEAYIEKPFSFGYLESQIVSLLTNRRKEREAFSKRPFFPVHNMKINKADKEFMNKIIDIIHENITDENFNVEKLADILHMSRSSLLRKIKILSNLSPLDFIRLIRLKKAAELIIEGKFRIAEISYQVGINSPSYFSKMFQKQFGMTPKEFEKQNQRKQQE